MSALEIIGSLVLAAGAGLSIVAAYGILVFPGALARMHAATKAASLGVSLMALGAGVAAGSPALVGLGFLVAVFMFVTAPISGHLLGRATYLAGQAPVLLHDDMASAPPRSVGIEPPVTRDFSVLRWLGLVLVWMLLWREMSPGTAAGGGAVAFVVESLRGSIDRPGSIRPGGLVPFTVGYLRLVMRSNLQVAWEVLTPNNDDIKEAIVAVPLEVDSMAAALLVANAVSFTPGTLSIELASSPLTLYVHVLHFESVNATVDDVRSIERLAGRVFPQSTRG